MGIAVKKRQIGFQNLPEDLIRASLSLPFPPPYLASDHYTHQLVSYLPPLRKTLDLIEAYYSRTSWMILPVDREQASEELIPMFYAKGQPVDPNSASVGNCHDLALLFSLLACGISMNCHDQTLAVETDKYYHLARAALSLGDVLERGSMATCQALLLIATYAKHDRGLYMREAEWKIISTAFTIATSVSTVCLCVFARAYNGFR